MKRIISVKIDRDTCLHHECCIDECPEVFGLSSEDEPEVKSGAEIYFDNLSEKIVYVANEICLVNAIMFKYDE